MKSKPATKAERRRMGIVKELGCIVCGSAPCHAHHLLSGGVRRGHPFTIGLCSEHHTEGMDSYHRAKRTFNSLHGTDDELLEATNSAVSDFERRTIGAAV